MARGLACGPFHRCSSLFLPVWQVSRWFLVSSLSGTGWLVSFFLVALPGHVLFHDVGGLSLTPPRNDNWAGTLGVFLGAVVWFIRNRLQSTALATILTGLAGGTAFVSAQAIAATRRERPAPRWAYCNDFSGYAGWQHRMGPHAEWKVNPKVRSQEHP